MSRLLFQPSLCFGLLDSAWAEERPAFALAAAASLSNALVYP